MHRASIAGKRSNFHDYAETASDWLWETDPDYKFTLLTENAFGGPGTPDWNGVLGSRSTLKQNRSNGGLLG